MAIAIIKLIITTVIMAIIIIMMIMRIQTGNCMKIQKYKNVKIE